jgi:hypothetical protein
MKMIDIRQISHLEKLVALTRLSLELRLPLAGALRAAKADLQMESLPDADAATVERLAPIGEEIYSRGWTRLVSQIGRWTTMKSPRE